jgi:hypothetical protein
LGDDAGGIALALSCDVLEGGERRLEGFIAAGVTADAVAIGEAGVVQVQIAPGSCVLEEVDYRPVVELAAAHPLEIVDARRGNATLWGRRSKEPLQRSPIESPRVIHDS